MNIRESWKLHWATETGTLGSEPRQVEPREMEFADETKARSEFNAMKGGDRIVTVELFRVQVAENESGMEVSEAELLDSWIEPDPERETVDDESETVDDES